MQTDLTAITTDHPMGVRVVGRADEVVRPRLEAVLDRIWNAQIGLVVAPAGYGKSTLLRRWSERYPDAVAWMTVTVDNRAPENFVSYAIESLRQLDSTLARNTVAMLNRPTSPGMVELGSIFTADVGRERDLCLVIDEAEQLIDLDVWAFLEAVVSAAPHRFRLLVASRVDPPMPLGRFLRRDQLVELRSSALLFTVEETRSLFTVRVPVFDAAVSDEVQRMTHGWPAGIRLALFARMHHSRSEILTSRSRLESGTSSILEALVAEIMTNVPESLVVGLLAATIVEEMNDSLALAMLGGDEDARPLVDAFGDSGMFVPIPSRHGWWRLHPLFRELLHQQLGERISRRSQNALHRRAATWFRDEGMVRPASRHFMAAGEIDDLVAMLEAEIPQAIEREDVQQLSDWIDDLPADLINETPSLSVARCWSLYFRASWGALRLAREQARALCSQAELNPTIRAAYLAELDVMESSEVVTVTLDPHRALELVDHAEPRLLPNRHFLRGHLTLYRASALESLGRSSEADAVIQRGIAVERGQASSALVRVLMARLFIARRRGDIATVEASATELLAVSRDRGFGLGIGWGRLFLGWAAFERNDLEEARHHLTEMVERGEGVHLSSLVQAMTLLARTSLSLNQRAEAAAVIRRVRELLVRRDAAELLPRVADFERFLAFQENPYRTPGNWVPASFDDLMSVTLQVLHHPFTIAMLVRCHSGDPIQIEEALAIGRQFENEVRRAHFSVRLPEILALQALALYASGATEEAADRLKAAIAFPFARSLYRTFADMGPLFRELLSHVQATQPAVDLAFLQPLVGRPRRKDGATMEFVVREAVQHHFQSGDAVEDLLTSRELDVLGCLDRDLTYRATGIELGISPQTVKRHAGAIYSKFGLPLGTKRCFWDEQWAGCR